MKKLALLAFVALFALAFSTTINVVSPVAQAVSDNGSIYIGRVGPGQTFSFAVEPKVPIGGVHNIGGRWDQMLVSRVPEGWKSRDAKVYADPLQAEVTVSQLAPNRQYEVVATVVDEGDLEKIGNSIAFRAIVDVDSNVVNMGIAKKSIATGAGQPARYEITITNTGMADDVFEISTTGVKDWEFRRRVYVGAGASKTITYEVVGQEEGEYDVKVNCASTSSPLITKSDDIHLSVNTDLFSDYRATTHGLLLFPLLEQPVYSIMGLISNLFQ